MTARVFWWSYVWEVDDDTVPISQVVAEARTELPAILYAENVIPAGPHAWTPGTGTDGTPTLTFTAPVVRATPNLTHVMEATHAAATGQSITGYTPCSSSGCDRVAGGTTGLCQMHRQQASRARRKEAA